MPRATPGPIAPWLEDELEGYAHRQTVRQVALALSLRLEDRIRALQATELDEGEVLMEIRRQVSECGVDGGIGRAAELADLVGELEESRSSQRL